MVQKFSCDDCLIAGLQWIPVLIVLSITGLSYFSYVVQFCLNTVDSDQEQAFYLVGYHILLVTFMCFYLRTIFSWSDVPQDFHVWDGVAKKIRRVGKDIAARDDILQHQATYLPLKTRSPESLVRYCDFCELIKPDRAHHCGPCGICSLRMDHHCPWINNCIAFSNYKFFVLFLGSLFLYCMFIAATTMLYVVDGSDMGTVLAPFCVSLVLATPIGGLFGVHLDMIAKNKTTMEAFHTPMFRSRHDKGFGSGSWNNFREVFGNNVCLWFLPVFSSLGDGYRFPPEARRRTLPKQPKHLILPKQPKQPILPKKP